MAEPNEAVVGPVTVLDFWFAPGMERRWFRGDDALDAEIRARFEPTWRAASSAALQHWTQPGGRLPYTPAEGALALVIVLDQLPLNMFRGQARAFATEALAVAVTRDAVDRALDRELGGPRRAFLYMPLMHSESLADQALSVQLFEQAGLDDNLRFARHHKDLIERFGRFPHRNALLGRQSSAAELAYLASPQAFHG